MINLNTSCITLLFDILYTRDISSRISIDKILFTVLSSMTFNTKLQAIVFVYRTSYISRMVM
jgi:hypothetical protein